MKKSPSVTSSIEFSFDQLSEPIFKAVQKLGYETPTEIQKEAIPFLLSSDGDFVGQAQTGTGKTAAFVLPLLEKLELKKFSVQALILSPTRELANQINEEILKFTKYLNIRTVTVYGGVGYREQIDNLKTAQIVIATPGRALDLLDRGKLPIQDASTLIIDEADEMLKMGFIEDVEVLMDNVSDDVKTWMFSATMPGPVKRLIEEKLNKPKFVAIKKQTLSNANVTQTFCEIQKKDFIKALRAILLTEKDFYGIVFCETREETRNLSDKLFNLGMRATSLHGDLSQAQRDKAIETFKSRKANIMVCTDVAARGLDISEVTHVINMGLPRKHDSYVHRIGRTGRAGQTGKAINFIAPSEFRNLKMIERLTNQRMERFNLPNAKKTKSSRISYELEKMQGIRDAVEEKGEDFALDDSFSVFEEYFSNLSKQEVVKILFSHYYKKDLRSIDETLESLEKSILRGPVAKTGSGRRDRRRPRRNDRNSRSEGRSGRRESGRGDRRDSKRFESKRRSTSRKFSR